MAYDSSTQSKGANGASLYSFMTRILNIFQKKVTGGATTITDDNLTASKALVSNASGKVAVSSVTSDELGKLSGVTGDNIQTQINGKMNKTINVDGTLTTTGGTVYYEGGDGINITWTNEDKLNFANTMMTSSTIGGGKLFSDTVQSVAANAVSSATGKTYGIQKNSSGQLVVNVPWSDTTAPLADANTAGIMRLYTSGGTSSDGTLTQGYICNTFARIASPTFSGTPTAPTATTGTNTTQIATTAFVQSEINAKMAGTASFKGAIDGSTVTDTTIKALDYKAGWYWVVGGTGGTYFGQYCEAGDHVYCIADKGASASNSDFSIIQSNVEWLSDADVADIISEALSA